MGKRIFIVNDDPVIRSLVSDYLSAFGYEVESLESGPDFLLRIKDSTPDLLFLDMQMPQMTGKQVLVELKSLGGTEIPVVMFSANEDPNTDQASDGVIPKAYLTKPFDLKELLKLAASV